MEGTYRDSPGRITIDSRWTSADRRDAARCRLGGRLTRYFVAPGLYGLAGPGLDSPVIVTGNYKLTFDIVRRDLSNAPSWILVLDTGGVDVHSAYAAGTFSTEELVTRVSRARLAGVVRHRDLVLPGLGAAGVDEAVVLKHAGFHVRVGPVRARDLPAFLESGEASPAMKEVTFPIRDRLALTPFEVGRALKMYAVFILAAFLYAGSTPAGVVFDKGWVGAWPLYVLGLGSVFCGSFLTPAAFPWLALGPIPARGWVIGGVITAALLFGAGLARGMDLFLILGCCAFFPAAAGFLAFYFSHALPVTDLARQRREQRILIPLFIAAAVVTAAALVLSRLRQWGLF